VAQKVERGIPLPFHDRSTRRELEVSRTTRPHFIPRKETVPIVQETGRAVGQVWTGGKSRPHWDCFNTTMFFLPYYFHIPIHTLFNLLRIRRPARRVCTVCHTLTVLPPLIMTHTDAFESVLSLSHYAPVVDTCYCCVPDNPGSMPFSSASREERCNCLTHLSKSIPSGVWRVRLCL
jgi:hypothetical protein